LAEDVLLVGAGSASPIIAWTVRLYMKSLKLIFWAGASRMQGLESDGEIAEVRIHAPQLVQSHPHFGHSHSAHFEPGPLMPCIGSQDWDIRLEYELPKLPGRGQSLSTPRTPMSTSLGSQKMKFVIVSSVSHGILGDGR